MIRGGGLRDKRRNTKSSEHSSLRFLRGSPEKSVTSANLTTQRTDLIRDITIPCSSVKRRADIACRMSPSPWEDQSEVNRTVTEKEEDEGKGRTSFKNESVIFGVFSQRDDVDTSTVCVSVSTGNESAGRASMGLKLLSSGSACLIELAMAIFSFHSRGRGLENPAVSVQAPGNLCEWRWKNFCWESVRFAPCVQKYMQAAGVIEI
ncbi:hypothetical protein AVEN_75599-1 [Araneus ventricosus]|uniref:Uncharacterized protein n=1 Tax=Araneus ventricosus TaxID=182803 RepID=A0A4Y2CL43_ARAVE|nr:hypothetical protein AVEN_75599-1 [Araneus ventricosus]